MMINDQNDFNHLAYRILIYLKECYRNGVYPRNADFNILAQGVNELQLYRTLKMLSDEGYITGLSFTPVKIGIIMPYLPNAEITMKGLNYLKDNSKTAQFYKIAKEVRDWIKF